MEEFFAALDEHLGALFEAIGNAPGVALGVFVLGVFVVCMPNARAEDVTSKIYRNGVEVIKPNPYTERSRYARACRDNPLDDDCQRLYTAPVLRGAQDLDRLLSRTLKPSNCTSYLAAGWRCE